MNELSRVPAETHSCNETSHSGYADHCLFMIETVLPYALVAVIETHLNARRSGRLGFAAQPLIGIRSRPGFNTSLIFYICFFANIARTPSPQGRSPPNPGDAEK